MKRLYSITLLALATILPAAAQQLFTTSFETESDFNAWKVYDINADGSTWKFWDTSKNLCEKNSMKG